MLLEQVLPELRAGKKIRRTSWEKEHYIAMLGEGLIVKSTHWFEPNMGLDGWEVMKEETWKDKVSEDNPCLCWVSDHNPDTRYGSVSLIIRYHHDHTSLPYDGMSGASWRYANPVSKEEMDIFMNIHD